MFKNVDLTKVSSRSGDIPTKLFGEIFFTSQLLYSFNIRQGIIKAVFEIGIRFWEYPNFDELTKIKNAKCHEFETVSIHFTLTLKEIFYFLI